MNITPLVSAVVTTHNRLELLPRALDSVAVQTYPQLELVVVDDGSEPQARSKVAEYSEVLPVKYIRNERSLGACRARNQGIQEASGEFIAGLDDDDEWNKDRIDYLMRAYDDEYAFITSDVRIVHKGRAPIWKKKKKITIDDLLYSNYVGNQGLIKTERLLAVGGFDEHLQAAQDYDLWIRLCDAFGEIRNVQQPLQDIYMDHGVKRITDTSSFEGYLQFYEKHKHRFNRAQRKYQLFNIRKAQSKPISLVDIIQWVPFHRYSKEIKWLLTPNSL